MEKLVNFAKSLLTNRPGIVLATLNLCYFASSDFSSAFFQLSNFDKIMLSVNAPAIVLSFVPHKLIHFLFPETDWLTLRYLSFIFLLFFVALQWLSICWTAKTIARKLKAD
ncbi:MAG: hypothetical protein M3384_03925 [Acidobacteriota bacterium]|nr:hypothetical protein [Acidobacteriota bacterium]